MRLTPYAFVWAAVLCAPSLVGAEAAPPEGSKPLTEILRPIEARSDFAYFEEVASTKSSTSQKTDQSRRSTWIR